MTVQFSDHGIFGYGCSRSPLGIGDDPFADDGLTSRGVHYHRRMGSSTSTEPRFTGRVRITNERADESYVPEYASSADMIRIANARRDRYQYQTVVNNLTAMPAGYTLSDLGVRFSNLNQQWQRSGNNYRFLGGVIFLDLEITLYVTDQARDKPRCRDLIMRHEMMHVADEQRLVNHTLPQSLPTLPYINSDFRTPIAERIFNRRIRGTGEGHGSELEQAIQRNVWVISSSRLASELHSDHPEHGEEILRCLRR